VDLKAAQCARPASEVQPRDLEQVDLHRAVERPRDARVRSERAVRHQHRRKHARKRRGGAVGSDRPARQLVLGAAVRLKLVECDQRGAEGWVGCFLHAKRGRPCGNGASPHTSCKFEDATPVE